MDFIFCSSNHSKTIQILWHGALYYSDIPFPVWEQAPCKGTEIRSSVQIVQNFHDLFKDKLRSQNCPWKHLPKHNNGTIRLFISHFTSNCSPRRWLTLTQLQTWWMKIQDSSDEGTFFHLTTYRFDVPKPTVGVVDDDAWLTRMLRSLQCLIFNSVRWTVCSEAFVPGSAIDETQSNNLTQKLVFLAGVELKKINSCLRRLI